MEQQQPYSAPPPPSAAPAYGSAYAPTNTLSIVSLVLGIAAFVAGLGPIAAVPAIITGHIGRNQIRQSGERGNGLALWGLILGYVNIGLTALALMAAVLAAVAQH